MEFLPTEARGIMGVLHKGHPTQYDISTKYIGQTGKVYQFLHTETNIDVTGQILAEMQYEPMEAHNFELPNEF